MIEILAVSYNGQPVPSELRGVFGPAGGTIGRGTENRLPLPDPMRHVSRVQGRVRWDGARFWIANVSEANPLFLNDEEIESKKERPLTPGDELRVGLYVLSVRETQGPVVEYSTAPPVVADSPLPGVPMNPGVVPAVGMAGEGLDSLLKGSASDNPFADLLGGAAPAPASLGPASLGPASLGPASLGPASLGTSAPAAAGDLAAARGYANLLDPLGPQPARPIELPVARATGLDDPLLAFGGGAAGDPLADLLRPARTASTPQPATSRPNPNAFPGGNIPADFDPFAAPQVSNAINSDDPLGELARSGLDLGAISTAPSNSLLEFDPARHADPRDALAGGTPSLMDPLEVVDPLQLFASADDRLLVPGDVLPADAMPMRDSLPEIGAYFRQPRPIQDPSPPSPAPAIAAPANPAVAAAAPPGLEVAHLVIPEAIAPAIEPPVIVASSTAIDVDEVVPTRRVAAEAIPAAVVPSPPTPPPPATAAVAAAYTDGPLPAHADGARTEQLVAAFLEGAHIKRAHVAGELTPERMHDLGELVYQAVAGAMALIAARQITKREMGADMTMIVSTNNNPLKFLPTPEAAMMQILGPSMPGFMNPVLAMTEAFYDLQAHELGVIAGTRAAFAELLHRFDPKALSEVLGKGGGIVDLVLPGARRGRLWNVFEARYQQIAREAENDFDSLYAEAFTNAYEAEVARHRGARRKS